MKIIGLTGGIATGKSTVTAQLRRNGFKIIDADELSRGILNHDVEALEAVKIAFGTSIFEGESLNRKALGEIVFSNKDQLKRLEDIIHPRVKALILAEIANQKNAGEKLVIIDAPLLIEGGLHEICDFVCVITVDEQIQIDRMIQRDKVSVSYAEKVISNQMTNDHKNQYADFILVNSGTLEALKDRVDELMKALNHLEKI